MNAKAPRLAIAIVAMIVALTAPHPGRAQAPQVYSIVMQLGPNPASGRSLGLIDPPPQDGSLATTTALLPFGNYVSQSSGHSVFARSYLYFPVLLPTETSVLTATLEVYVDSWPFDGTAEIGIYNAPDPWDETMTWDTRAALDPLPAGTTNVSSSKGWYAWDVTALVNSWHIGAPNNGLALAAVPPQDSGPVSPPGWAGRGPGRTGPDLSLAPRLTIYYRVTPTPTAPPTSPPTDTATPTSTNTPPPLTTQPPKPPKEPPEPTSTAGPTPTTTLVPTPMLLPETGHPDAPNLHAPLALVTGLVALWTLRTKIYNRNRNLKI